MTDLPSGTSRLWVEWVPLEYYYNLVVFLFCFFFFFFFWGGGGGIELLQADSPIRLSEYGCVIIMYYKV